jgi:CobQ-like glutamine amidotransferase family enzyme
MSSIIITSVFPELLSIYADRGNVIVLMKRAEWRGLEPEFKRLRIGEDFDPGCSDLVMMGGGQDKDQAIVSEYLLNQESALKSFVESGKPLLAVCGSYQLLGHTYEFGSGSSRQKIEGLGLFDMETVAGSPRLIGEAEVEVSVDGTLRRLCGFENHSGRTHLNPGASPLGRVIAGHGNDGDSLYEGVRYRNAFGTYLHGPLLPRNPWFADHLLDLASA